MNNLTVKVVSPEHEDLANLIQKLDEELLERYPAEEIFGVDFSDPTIRDAVFVVAYHEDQPVGCGGIRPIDEVSTELKRFYVDKSLRKLGIAGRMLEALESEAKNRSFTTIKLETGTEQPESVHFYKKHGFYEIDKFGEYVDCPSSLCFEKQLA